MVFKETAIQETNDGYKILIKGQKPNSNAMRVMTEPYMHVVSHVYRFSWYWLVHKQHSEHVFGIYSLLSCMETSWTI